MTERFPGGIPAMSYIRIDAEGTPSLAASRCNECGAVLFGKPRACAACGVRTLVPAKLSDRGRLHTWTIVQRSFAGVVTPFIAVVVELDGSGVLKGTLRKVAADPAALRFDMPVRLVFDDSGQRDDKGRPFIGYFFEPAEENRP